MLSIESVPTANNNNTHDNENEEQLEQGEVDGFLIELATKDDAFLDLDHIDGFVIEASVEEVGGLPYSEV